MIDGDAFGGIELGQSGVKLPDLRLLLDLYEVADEERRASCEGLARDGRRRGWWQSYGDVISPQYQNYIGLETGADSLRNFETTVVPGLLQTADYARAVARATQPSSTEDELNSLVDVRLARQMVLSRERAVDFWAIVDEAVLRRVVGGRETMRAQLEKVADWATRPNVTLQVLPFAAGAYDAIHGPFVIVGFPVLAEIDVVCVENLTSTLYIEESRDVARYVRAFELLRATALAPDASMGLIDRAAKDL